MLRGQLRAAQQLALLSSHDDLAQALEGAFFVQVTALPHKQRVCLSPELKIKHGSHNLRFLVVVFLANDTD